MVQGLNGEQVRIEFSSANASTASAVTLYKANDASTAAPVSRTLAATERLLIANLVCSFAVGVDIFDDKDADGVVDAGERLISKNGAATTPFFADYSLSEGVPCGIGRLPQVKASGAGQIDITGIGYIING